MKRLVLLLTAAFLLQAHAEQHTVKFAGQTYRLDYVDVSKNGAITNEYVLPGQNVNSWTSLLAVRQWPDAGTVGEVAAAWVKMVKPLLTRDIEVYKPNEEKGNNDIVVEAWLSAPDKSYIEINLHRFVKEPGVSGIKAYQYAQIIKMKDGKGNVDDFLNRRDALFEAIGRLDVPAYKRK